VSLFFPPSSHLSLRPLTPSRQRFAAKTALLRRSKRRTPVNYVLRSGSCISVVFFGLLVDPLACLP
jgi:hypothetical protein